MKKYQSFILILCLVLANVAFLSGQPVHTSLGDVIMPSPEAASLGKYGDVPIGYATGVTNISVPIHNVQEGPLSLPISLNYHASGIKVAETASWVGQGWSLMAGGRITRTVLGMADEDGGGYWEGGHEIGPEPSNPTASEMSNYNSFIMHGIMQGTRDGEPDIFSFNFGGYSGKFYFDSNNDVHQVPVSDLKIETDIVAADAGEFESFTITTTDGTRYFFGSHNGIEAYESTIINNFSENYRSGWMLIKIESADGLYAIDFNYTSESYQYKNLTSGVYTISEETNGSGYTYPGNNGSDNVNRYYTWTAISGNRLSSIITSTETITFEANTNREDISSYLGGNCKRLDRIKIQSGTFCKGFNFQYNYFVDHNESSVHKYAKRLKLEELQEVSCDNTEEKNPYIFEYEGSYLNGKQFIPHRLSKAIDHWGFYNGASGNELLAINVPETTVDHPYANIPDFYTFGESNRESDGQFAKIGTLKKITYPTKGYTEFDFEGNSVFGLTGYQKSYPVSLTNCEVPDEDCCNPQDQEEMNYTFSDLQEVELALFKIGAVNPRVLGPGDFPCGQVSMNAKVQILNAGSSVLLGTYNIDLSIDEDDETAFDIPLSELYVNVSPNVEYTFRLTANNCKGTFDLITRTPQYGQLDVGGIRISSLTKHDNIDHQNDEVKTFEYADGVLIDKPSYAFGGYYADELCSSPTFCTEFYKYYIQYFARGIVPLGGFNGSNIIYGKVTENLNGIGYNEYSYDTPAGYNYSQVLSYYTRLNIFNTPENFQGGYRLTNDHIIGFGKLKFKESYDESDNKVYSEQINNLTWEKPAVGYVIKMQGWGNTGLNPQFRLEDRGGSYLASIYQYRTGSSVVHSKIVEVDGITTTTEYEYDSQKRHHSPTVAEVTNSDGEVYKTVMDYVFDYSYSSAIRTSLIDKNMIGIPFQTRNFVGTTLTGGSRTIWAMYANSTGNRIGTSSCSSCFPRPNQFFSAEVGSTAGVMNNNGSWVLKGEVDNYHSNNSIIGRGLPKQYTHVGWLPEIYEWKNGKITKKTYGNYEWLYEYFPNTTMLEKVTGIDGQYQVFKYDALSRLERIRDKHVNGTFKKSTVFSYGFANGSNHNYVRSNIYYVPKPNSGISSQQSTQYFDGLGRLMQTVDEDRSPDGRDVVTAVTYDEFGRVKKQYDPYHSPNSDGEFIAVPGSVDHTTNAYEDSPLSRLLSSTHSDWHPTTYDYGANSSGDAVKINGGTSNYGAGLLSKTTVTDPNGNHSITYKDKLGRVVLSERANASHTESARTYNVYDAKNRLVKVIPPDATTNNNGLTFRYDYTGFDQVTRKYIPDAGYIDYKYDDRDLPVLVQDENQRTNNRWVGSALDNYGQTTETGFVTGSSPNPDNFTISTKHTENQYGTSGIELGKVIYSEVNILGTNDYLKSNFTFDELGRVETMEGNNHLNLGDLLAEVVDYKYDYADNLTEETRIHKAFGTTTTIAQRHVVDHWGRNTHNYHQVNSNAEVLLSEIDYTYKDQVAERNLGGAGSSALQSIDFSYRPVGFLESINQIALGGTTANLSLCGSNMPDAGYDSSTPDQNDLFFLNLRYDNLETNVSGTPRYNGDISQVIWRTRGRQRQAYRITYDYLNRMEEADYFDFVSGTAVNNERFNEEVTYADARGNIGTLRREGLYKNSPTDNCFNKNFIDDLTYTYQSGTNKLTSISEAVTGAAASEGFTGGSGNYQYDANGNMLNDPYKSLSMVYNYLNLPSSIDAPGFDSDLTMLYAADGTKLQQDRQLSLSSNLVRDYVGGIEYVDGKIEAIYHGEGRIVADPAGRGFAIDRYEYNLTDHLGNVRLVFSDKNGNGRIDQSTNPAFNEVLQENHYYPFGMRFGGNWAEGNVVEENRYQYNGKEFVEEVGLNDYGARWYDPAIARWTNVDPLADSYAPWSPYNYVMGNPLRFIDPDGMAPDDIILRFRAPDGTVVMTLDYRKDGKLYDNRNGKEYTGNNTWALKTRDAINEARGNHEGLDRMFRAIENDSGEHEWTNSSDKANGDPISQTFRSGFENTVVQFNPDADQNAASAGGREPIVESDIAAHEGKHQYNYMTNSNKGSKPKDGVSDEEVDAVNTENLNRSGSGRKPRRSYNGWNISKERLLKPRYDPAPYHPNISDN